jgi:hypothetical protein
MPAFLNIKAQNFSYIKKRLMKDVSF